MSLTMIKPQNDNSSVTSLIETSAEASKPKLSTMTKQETENNSDESSDESSVEASVEAPVQAPIEALKPKLPTRPRTFVKEVGAYDVLLGRGTGPSMNEGNVHFRDAVERLKSSYIATPSRKTKKQIVRKIVSDTKAKKGRFLNKLSKTEINALGLFGNVYYEVVPDAIALEKTKQAIRYVHYKKDNRKRSKSFGGEVGNPDLLRAGKKARFSPRIGEASPTLDAVPPLNLNSFILPGGGRAPSLESRLQMLHQSNLVGASSLLSSPTIQALLGSRVGLGPPPLSLGGLPLLPLGAIDPAVLSANLQLSKAVAAMAARGDGK